MTALDLQDRVVVVLGAGSSGPGLSNGEAAAVSYAHAGAAVVAVDRNPDEAARVAARITADGGTSIAVEADVTLDSDMERVFKETVAKLGVPHVVHGNVGVARTGSVLDLDPDQWRAAIDVNLTGAYLAFRHALPPMLEAGRGVFVNVSSLASIRYTGYQYPAYSAAKAALNQLTSVDRSRVRLPRNPCERDPARSDRHPPGRTAAGQQPGGDRCAARPEPYRENGFTLGRRKRRSLLGLRQGRLHQRRLPSGGWWIGSTHWLRRSSPGSLTLRASWATFTWPPARACGSER